MILKTKYNTSIQQIEDAVKKIPEINFRLALNEPSGRFFYDSWVLKKEFTNTVWKDILSDIKEPIGEARLIKMDPGSCYNSHSDIDDRFHLSLTGENCYLIDLDNEVMYKTEKFGQWYLMDTSVRHTAANFGSIPRVQLVVRNLLKENVIDNAITVNISPKQDDPTQDSRYVFDNVLSPWLNIGCKQGFISNVNAAESSITFDVDRFQIKKIESLLKDTGLTVHYEY